MTWRPQSPHPLELERAFSKVRRVESSLIPTSQLLVEAQMATASLAQAEPPPESGVRFFAN
jgi:hypothetical protein